MGFPRFSMVALSPFLTPVLSFSNIEPLLSIDWLVASFTYIQTWIISGKIFLFFFPGVQVHRCTFQNSIKMGGDAKGRRELKIIVIINRNVNPNVSMNAQLVHMFTCG